MKTSVAIVGAGPGGASCALHLANRGIQATIIERDEFPRYHVGESLTGECGNCLRRLGLGEVMEGKPVKYGVRVYGPGGKNSFWIPVMGRNENGLFQATTWQVRRSEFDKALLDRCKELGVNVIRGEAVDVVRDGDAVTGVQIKKADGSLETIESQVLIDATGPGTFLSRIGVAGTKERGNYANQVAIFSQVENTIRDQGTGPDSGDNTLIIYQEKHHWGWFIPLDKDKVSVGIVTPSEYFASRKESKEDFLRRELQEMNGELARRVPDTTFHEEVRAASNYSYHVKEFTGKGYLCIGDSHRFIDPIFSFGLFMAMKEAEEAARIIDEHLKGAGSDRENPFADFQAWSEGGNDVLQDLVDAFWNNPFGFAVCAHSRYVEDTIDMFAGRVHGWEKPLPGLIAYQKINRAVMKNEDKPPLATPAA